MLPNLSHLSAGAMVTRSVLITANVSGLYKGYTEDTVKYDLVKES